ncbi:MAG: DUF488 domain-containing protein [Dehalococcoidia bacterium]|jgi:uncharacterized protein (DUF488 family)|nr:DUF488 domain-containing protein [Dehalococcoidia bacterium]PWB69367.1 MAG: hypothetical protein C3F15_15170 [Holophagae bacterium]
MAYPLYTVGHSNHTADDLLDLLRRNGISVVVDVRSSPFSRYCPQFNREQLARHCAGKLRYVWMGDSLGGRPADPAFYDEAGHVLYAPLSRTESFLSGIGALERNAERYSIAILCSEADPIACHRSLLITRVLRDRGMPDDRIRHILANGTVRNDSELPVQVPMLEDAWRSPLSVLHEPALNPSSGA